MMEFDIETPSGRQSVNVTLAVGQRERLFFDESGCISSLSHQIISRLRESLNSELDDLVVSDEDLIGFAYICNSVVTEVVENRRIARVLAIDLRLS